MKWPSWDEIQRIAGGPPYMMGQPKKIKLSHSWSTESIEELVKQMTAEIDAEILGKPLPETKDEDECPCTARDLLWYGHKCGRKAPIDK